MAGTGQQNLVQFRGQWMHLNQDKMQQMLEFWKKAEGEPGTHAAGLYAVDCRG